MVSPAPIDGVALTTFDARVFDRSDNAVLMPSNVALLPQRWTAEAVGGPRSAEIALAGSVDGMLALANWLGYQINILAAGELVWWGQIDALSVTVDGLTREISLDGVANRVKVLYSERLSGGSLAGQETTWGEDAASVAAYGKRELVHSASGSLTEAQAMALQVQLLVALAQPQKRLRVGGAQAGGRITARGYWQRLGDVYYAQVAGIEAHAPGPGTAIPLGLGLTSAYLGFGGSDGAKRLHSIYGHFTNWGYAGLKIVVSESDVNYGIKTIASADRKEPATYTANTIFFDPANDIDDTAIGLGFLTVEDVIWISGATAPGNNGAKLVKTAQTHHIEISTGWSGGEIVTGAAGPAITIARGNSITIEEAVTNERPDGTTDQTVTAYGQKVYQTFALAQATTWTLATVEIRVRRIGDPADNLRVALYTDSSGAPGALVEAVTVAGATLTDTMEWLTLTFANTAALSYGTTYGLLIERTGGMDAAAFYEVAIDADGGYTRGALRLHDGTIYQAASGDLIFRCLGAQDTASQMSDAIQGTGTELTAVMVENSSGLSMLQYQAGDETAGAIIKALLDQGVSTGARLLATVASNRDVRIYAQAAAVDRLTVWRAGKLQRAVGGAVADGWLPVGTWMHMDDLAMTGAWASLSPVFVERATYQVGSGLSIEAEYQEPLAGALSGVKQG